jgi:hypothetical protein
MCLIEQPNTFSFSFKKSQGHKFTITTAQQHNMFTSFRFQQPAQ